MPATLPGNVPAILPGNVPACRFLWYKNVTVTFHLLTIHKTLGWEYYICRAIVGTLRITFI